VVRSEETDLWVVGEDIRMAVVGIQAQAGRRYDTGPAAEKITKRGFYDEIGERYQQALDNPDAVVLVVEDDEGEVVGMAYGEARTPSRFSDERALEVSGLVVRAGYRGRGVGRELVGEAARFAEERGIEWIELKTFAPNRGAMEFWEDLGFSPRVVQLTSGTRDLLDRLGT